MNFTTENLYEQVLNTFNSLTECNKDKSRVSVSSMEAVSIVDNYMRSFNVNGNQFVKESNENPLLKYRIAKSLFESLANYNHLESVAALRNYISNAYNENSLRFQVSNVYDNVCNYNGSLYENLSKDLMNAVDSESIESDIKRIANQNPWNNQIKALSESLSYNRGEAVSTKSCTVNKVYSPILVTNEGVIFHIHGKNYISDGKTVNECAMVNDINYNNVINGLNLAKIQGEEINFYGTNKVLSFNTNEGSVKLNDTDLTECNSFEIKDALIANNFYDIRNISNVDIVSKFFESVDCLRAVNSFYDIKSNDFLNLYLTVIAVEEGYYVNYINGSMQVNEMKYIPNAENLVEYVKENINYDITNVVLESLVEEGNKKAEIEKTRQEISESIAKLEEKKEMVNKAIEKLGNTPELSEALDLISQEIRKNEKSLQMTYEKNVNNLDEYVDGSIISNINGFERGDVIKVNALQYTSGKDNDMIDIIDSTNKETKIAKRYISISLK